MSLLEEQTMMLRLLLFPKTAQIPPRTRMSLRLVPRMSLLEVPAMPLRLMLWPRAALIPRTRTSLEVRALTLRLLLPWAAQVPPRTLRMVLRRAAQVPSMSLELQPWFRPRIALFQPSLSKL